MIKSKVNIIYKCHFEFALKSPDRFEYLTNIAARNQIGGMFNYFSNEKKRAINMFDYFAGKINKVKRANIIFENGEYATDEELSKRKKEYLKYFKNSHLWKGIISFDTDYIDKSIELEKLEQILCKEVMPRYLRYCGFKDIDKMSYQLALHTNASHYHFHLSFIEKEPNYICADGKIRYRRKGLMSKEEKDYLKRELGHAIDRYRVFTPLVIKSNEQIDDLKKYFRPGERNFILKDYEDLVLEENLLKLGKMLNDKRKGKSGRIKFNSINDQEIKELTKNIKNYLFKNKRSSLYKTEEEFKKSLNAINDYFHTICKDNNIKGRKYQSDYVKEKEQYIDNYIYNAIVNHASYKFNRLKQNHKYLNDNDIIQEAILKMYKKSKKQSKYDLLVNYLTNITKESRFKNKYKIEQSIKSINSEMEEAISEFSKLFKNDENRREESY